MSKQYTQSCSVKALALQTQQDSLTRVLLVSVQRRWLGPSHFRPLDAGGEKTEMESWTGGEIRW